MNRIEERTNYFDFGNSSKRRRTGDGFNGRGFLGNSNIELKESSVGANFAHTAYATDKDKLFGAVIYLKNE